MKGLEKNLTAIAFSTLYSGAFILALAIYFAKIRINLF